MGREQNQDGILSKDSGEAMMEEKPGTIVIVNTVEHEDGSATYTFDLDKSSSTKLTELGLEVVLTCAAYTIDVQDALGALRAYAREKHNDEG